MFRPQRYSDFTRLCLLLASVIWTTVAGSYTASGQGTQNTGPSNGQGTQNISVNPNPNAFDTPQIMTALSNPHSDLVVLSAHRGLHALAGLSQTPGVSENSLASIGYAAEAGWESIELDVKLTSDGVPILSHDRTWGREWCGLAPVIYPGSLSPYDPFTPPGSSINDVKNPTVTGTTLSNTRSFLGNTVLRDSVSLLNPFTNHGCNGPNQLFGEYPPTLADALSYISKNKIRMVVFLDIQSIQIAQAAYNIVATQFDDAGRSFLQSVVFKMPAALFPQHIYDFEKAFGADSTKIWFIPVINTSDVAPEATTITDTEDGGFDLSDVGLYSLGGETGINNWISYIETLETTSGFLRIPAVEVNYKEPGGILSSVLPVAKINQRTNALMTVGTFNPVGEYYGNGTTPLFFRSSNGTCCDPLTAYLYNNPNGTGPIDPSQPMDKTDQRTNLTF